MLSRNPAAGPSELVTNMMRIALSHIQIARPLIFTKSVKQFDVAHLLGPLYKEINIHHTLIL